ncbi:conjugal transfer protein TraG N-terminal domain-containing protein [Citrobacter portucalensis]|uniref:conjugal transfer protein TraG N-terminal domain-containing protein n=4 Tax=Citrobacter freundii complex TaxID=1344959 RepID=UPI002FE5B031
MNKHLILLVGLLAVSPAVFAYDGEYVVMGGFTTIVNAFTRIKFIFNDNQYQFLLTAFVVMGAVSGLLISSAKKGVEFLEPGTSQMGLGWLAMTLVGTMFYFGMVQTKGTIHIYDQTRNQYQAVSGVPDFLILTASVTNQVYQAIVDISNRDTATTTRFTGEGTPIKMLLGVLNRNGAQYDPYLTQNVRTMWNMCAPVAETRGFDTRSLKSGSAVLDVVSAISPLRNQAVYTNWITASNPSGSSITCDQAYVTLKSDLGNPDAYGARLKDICTKSGYNADNATQLADCKGRMEAGFQTIFGASGLSLNTAMSNVLVSQAIADAMTQNNPDVATTLLTNRAMINGGMADAVSNPEWLSFIMAGVIAIILSITPLLLLLALTPLMGKALTLLFGLWVFITTWQIADVLLLQAGTDEILTAMNDIKSMGLGIDAIQMGPTSTMKAMSVMASARETAVQIAMLVAGIFGVSAYGLSAFGQKALSRLDRVTDDAGDKSFTPEGQGAQIDAMRRGHASLMTAGEVGSISAMSNASSFRDSADIYGATSQISGMGGTTGSAAQRSGAVEGGRATGTVLGYENGNQSGGFAAASNTSMVSTQSNVGESAGVQEAATASGMTVTDQSAMNTGVNTTMQTADAKSNLEHGGGKLDTLGAQQRDVHSTERGAQIGHAAGIKDAAASTGKSVTAFTKESTSTSAVNEHASGQGQLEASGGTLSGLHSRSKFTAAAESDERQGHSQALHNAYDSEGGISAGVNASQTENLTQNLHDMREQKANVDEIREATGLTTGQSRDLMAAGRSAEQMGVLEGNNYDPRAIQGNTAWSSEKGANIIKGEKTAFEERDEKMPEFAERRGEVDMHQAMSEQEQFNKYSNSLGGDKSAADALTGSKTLAVTKQDADALEKSSLITKPQADAVNPDGAAVVTIASRELPDGKQVSTSNVTTGNSTNRNDSYVDQGGQTFGSPQSAQQNLQDPQAIERLYAASERKAAGSGHLVLGAEIASGLSPFLSQSGNENTQQTISGGIRAGDTGFLKKAGEILGFKVNAGVTMNEINGRSLATNQISAGAAHKIEQYRDSATLDANAAHMTGQAKEDFINQTVAVRTKALNDQLREAGMEVAYARTNGSIVDGVSTPKSNDSVPRTDDVRFNTEYGSSGQEYVERMRTQQPITPSVSSGSHGGGNHQEEGGATEQGTTRNGQAGGIHPPVAGNTSDQGIPVRNSSSKDKGLPG